MMTIQLGKIESKLHPSFFLDFKYNSTFAKFNHFIRETNYIKNVILWTRIFIHFIREISVFLSEI